LEKGEVLILTIQFGALILAVLLLSGFYSSQNASSTPAIQRVYWGSPPPAGVSIGRGTNTEATNASLMTVYYTLAAGTHIVSFSASRLCTNPKPNSTLVGSEDVYTHIPQYYDPGNKENYFTFGPTGQLAESSCLYTISITDSLTQTSTWVGTVIVKAPTSA